MIADLEMMPNRPLDMFRDWWWPYATLRNLVLLFIGVSFGGHRGSSCTYENSGPCPYWQYVTINGFIDKDMCMYIGGLAWMGLALFSDGMQWLLGSCFFQFFGRISYSLYLVHALFVFFIQNDIVRNLHDRGGMNYDKAVAISFFSCTPVLIFVAWILTLLVDEPYKDFAYEVDMAFRFKQPPARTAPGGGEVAKSDIEEKPKTFFTNSWKFFGLVVYMLTVYATTEAYTYYAANQSMRDEYDNE
jgi:hypothetical protein